MKIETFKFHIVGNATRKDGVEIKLSNMQTRANLVPGIVMDNTPFNLAFQTNQWLDFPCLEFMLVRTDANGKATYGIRTFVGKDFLMGKEGMLMDFKSPFHVIDTADQRSLETGIYYAAISPNQNVVWDEMRKGDIDALQNTTSEKNAYNAAVNDPTPDENVVLTPDFMIKKK